MADTHQILKTKTMMATILSLVYILIGHYIFKPFSLLQKYRKWLHNRGEATQRKWFSDERKDMKEH